MKAKAIIAIIILLCTSLLLLTACNNPFMERILGLRSNQEAPYTGPFGSGTEIDPWRVYDRATLLRVGKDPDNGWTLDAHYEQVRNITWSGNWTPIGDLTDSFTGTYNGNGRTITGLTIDYTFDGIGDSVPQGLFGRINGTVRNLGLVNVNIIGDGYVGGIAGLNDGGTVTNCFVTGTVRGTNNSIGGVVGQNHNEVRNSYSTADVSSSGGNSVGGIVGDNYLGATVENCYATGNVNGSSSIGGVVGFNSSTVRNCYATGDVNGSSSIGGVVGFNSSTVQNCYATGDVGGTNWIGGVVGNNSGTVQNCYARGNVTGTNDVGGIVGSNGNNVQNCYATGRVEGNNNVGGIAGNTSGAVENCVALNIDIDGFVTETRGRVAGIASSGTLPNNYGTDALIGLGHVGPNEKGGVTINAADWNSALWWQNTADYDPNIWLLRDNTLPFLQ